MLDQAERISAPVALLNVLAPLSGPDRAALQQVVTESVREVPARRDILREGDQRTSLLFVLQGWGCRYKQLPDGRRQVVSFMLPGDMCDADTGITEYMDHTIGAITTMKVAEVKFQRFAALRERHPAVSQAIARYQRAQIAIQREWSTSLGQRSAIERLAHLLCELFLRMDSVGAAERNSCDLPLTQTDLADACGLTPVHLNRTLQELRREGIVEHFKRRLIVPDLGALMNRGLFEPSYLHLARSRKSTSHDG